MRYGLFATITVLLSGFGVRSQSAGEKSLPAPASTFFDAAPFDGAELDLAALADGITDGAEVSLVGAFPAEVLAEARRMDAMLQPDERELLLQFGASGVGLAAAVAVLAEPTAPGRDGIRRSLLACRMLDEMWKRRKAASRIGLPGLQQWQEGVQPLVRQHAHWLAGRLLREDLDATNLRTLAVCDPPADVPWWRYLGEIVRRLGPAADRHHWLSLSTALLAAGELDAVERALAVAVNAPPTAVRDVRHQDVVDEQILQERLAEARRWRAAADGAGLDAQIAELQLLRLTDVDAAVARSRAMCAADVDHALPYSVLAADALLTGRKAEVGPLLAAAEQHQGADLLTASLNMVTRAVELQQRLAAQPDEQAALAEFAALMACIDRMLEADPSESARMFLALRQLGMTDPQRMGEFLEDLPTALDLAERFPDSLQVVLLTLATAANLRSAETVAVFERAMPAAMLRRPDLLAQRATVMCEVALALGTPTLDESIAAALDQLQEVQGDALDAEYLRGMLAWSRGVAGEDRDQLEAARRHFQAARSMPTQRGGFRAEVACCIADGVLEVAPWDLSEVMRARQVAGVSADEANMQPVLAVVAAHDGSTARIAGVLEQMSALSRYVVHASVAAAASARDDAAAARAAARAALALDLSEVETGVVLAEHGVLASHEFVWDVNANVRHAGVDIKFSAILLPLMPIPGRARLEQLAGD